MRKRKVYLYKRLQQNNYEEIRKDHTNRVILGSIFINNRLKWYELYLKLALDFGYKVCSMVEFYREKPIRALILRHDVDSITPVTRKMFELEKSIGVTNTYYFRFSTYDRKLINDMHEAGFEVGLHYEPIADYSKEKNIQSASEIDFEETCIRLRKEIRLFDEMTGWPSKSCASHGEAENIRLKVSNNILFEIKPPDYFGVLYMIKRCIEQKSIAISWIAIFGIIMDMHI